MAHARPHPQDPRRQGPQGGGGARPGRFGFAAPAPRRARGPRRSGDLTTVNGRAPFDSLTGVTVESRSIIKVYYRSVHSSYGFINIIYNAAHWIMDTFTHTVMWLFVHSVRRAGLRRRRRAPRAMPTACTRHAAARDLRHFAYSGLRYAARESRPSALARGAAPGGYMGG